LVFIDITAHIALSLPPLPHCYWHHVIGYAISGCLIIVIGVIGCYILAAVVIITPLLTTLLVVTLAIHALPLLPVITPVG